MPDRDPPSIGRFFNDLDRRRTERDEELFRSASERRRAVERFGTLRREVVLPVIRELQRELRRRRHALKVVERDASLMLTVAIHGRHARHGSLRLRHPGKTPDSVRLEYEGIAIVPDHFDVGLDKVDRQLVTRAVLRLVEDLMAE